MGSGMPSFAHIVQERAAPDMFHFYLPDSQDTAPAAEVISVTRS